MARAAATAHSGSERAAWSSATSCTPSASAAASASVTPAPRTVPPPAAGSRETSTTPASAHAIPASCQDDGRSPVTSPATTGTTALVARIGAATLMAPTDIER